MNHLDYSNVVILVEFFNKLKNTSSTLLKQSLIEENIEHISYLEPCLRFLLDPNIKTNISRKKILKSVKCFDHSFVISDFLMFLDYLSNESTGKDVDIFIVNNYINLFNDFHIKSMLQDIAIKKLKLGISLKLVNKVFKRLNYSLIYDFKVQTGIPFKKAPDDLGYFYLTEKLDGHRFVVIKENGIVKAYSRQGKLQIGYDHILNEFSSDLFPDNYIYDGELIIKNRKDYNSMDSYRKTLSIASKKDGDKTSLEYYIFDSIPLIDFLNGVSKDNYSKRRLFLNQLKPSDPVYVLPVLYEGTDISKITSIGDDFISNGFEGIMINLDKPYVTKRTSSLIKYKNVCESDGLIVDVYEGDGKYKGMLGGVCIQYLDTTINIGSGFSDKERVMYWENKDLLIGKIGAYQYTDESRNNDGSLDVRFARWKGLRPDKSRSDVYFE